MLNLFEKLVPIKLSETKKQAEVRYKLSIYKVLVHSLCQDLFLAFGGQFVGNTCSL